MATGVKYYALDWCKLCHRSFFYPFDSSPWGHLQTHKISDIEKTDFSQVLELAYDNGNGWRINCDKFKEVKKWK